MGASPGDHLKIYYYSKTNINENYGNSSTSKKIGKFSLLRT